MCAVMAEEEQELTLNEAAKRLHTSPFSVRRRILEGKLRARREGGQYRIRLNDLQDYIKRTFEELQTLVDPEEESP